MATTTNYSWSTPDDTALVKDGAAAIRSLGTAIDTTVFNNASAAIAKTIVDAKGDIIAATAADTVARLAVGSNNQVLVADSTTATGLKWATPAAGGKVLQVVQATNTTETTTTNNAYVDTNLSGSITPSSATSKIMVIVSQPIQVGRGASGAGTAAFGSVNIMRDSTEILTRASNTLGIAGASSADLATCQYISNTYLDSPATTSAITYKTQMRTDGYGFIRANLGTGASASTSVMLLLEIGA
jgi:hypothetical protein